jgi:DNA polymerase-1
MSKIFLIDAMNLAFRSYYAFAVNPPRTSTGKPTAVPFGAAMFMHRLLSEYSPDHMVLALESKTPTFRHELFPEYKANRQGTTPSDFGVQIPDFLGLFMAMGVKSVSVPGFEADDVIGTLAKKYGTEGHEVYIVSGDKDFCQLVDNNIKIIYPKNGDFKIIDAQGVVDKFGVLPSQVIDCLAILGDRVDNVPGVKGIGEKGAAELLKTYGNLSNVLANANNIQSKRYSTALQKSMKEAVMSKTLVTISLEVPVPYSLEDMKVNKETMLNNPELRNLYSGLEFNSLLSRMVPSPGIESPWEIPEEDGIEGIL